MFQQSKSEGVVSGVHSNVSSTGHAQPVHYLRTVGALAIPDAYLVDRTKIELGSCAKLICNIPEPSEGRMTRRMTDDGN